MEHKAEWINSQMLQMRCDHAATKMSSYQQPRHEIMYSVLKLAPIIVWNALCFQGDRQNQSSEQKLSANPVYHVI